MLRKLAKYLRRDSKLPNYWFAICMIALLHNSTSRAIGHGFVSDSTGGVLIVALNLAGFIALAIVFLDWMKDRKGWQSARSGDPYKVKIITENNVCLGTIDISKDEKEVKVANLNHDTDELEFLGYDDKGNIHAFNVKVNSNEDIPDKYKMCAGVVYDKDDNRIGQINIRSYANYKGLFIEIGQFDPQGFGGIIDDRN